jgi:hypothetical protein
MRGREPCAHATPSCRAKTRRSVSCYWHVLLLAVACIADAGVTAARVSHNGDAAHSTPQQLHESTTPPPPSMTLMPSGGNETSGNEPTTQESRVQRGDDTNATNATQPSSGDTPAPGSEQTCRQTLTHIAVRPGGGSQWCVCADERKDCNCAGLVRYGHAESSLWAESLWKNGTIACREATFGGDPAREKSPLASSARLPDLPCGISNTLVTHSNK